MLESIVKPWWLSPTVFSGAMILATIVVLGNVALSWYAEAFFLLALRAM